MKKVINNSEKKVLKKNQTVKIESFLGIKILNLLDEKSVVGGSIPEEIHHHEHCGRHHRHTDTAPDLGA